MPRPIPTQMAIDRVVTNLLSSLSVIATIVFSLGLGLVFALRSSGLYNLVSFCFMCFAA